MSDESNSTPSTPSEVSAPNAETAKSETAPSQSSKVETKVEGGKVPETKAPETPSEKQRFKVKIDKEEKEIDEDELLRGYQLRQASDKRFKEASARQKEAESFLELLKTKDGLKKVLAHPDVGQDVYKLAEELLAEKLEEEFLDPKEKEIRAIRAEREALLAEKKEREESERSTKEAAEIKGYEAEYAADIESTIKANGLPMNIHTVNGVRDYMLMAMENGNEDVKASDVIAEVKRDYQEAVKSLMSSNDIAAIVSLVGEETLKKIRDYDVARLKDPKKPTKVAKEDQPAEKPRREKPIITVNEYFDAIKKRLGD